MRKITRRSFLAAAAACGAAAALSACGGSSASSAAASSVASSTAASVSAAADGQKFTVGICQLVQHAALDAATQGFEDALTAAFGDNVTFDFQNAQGDSATCATITNGFVSSSVDLIMANATPALQAAQAATNTIPVLGTSVTEYGVALGLDNFSGTVGGNVSGTSDLAPLDQQADMIVEWMPDAKKVGLLYCSAEANSQYQVDEVQKYLEAKGVTATQYAFSDSNDLSSVCQKAADENDALYVPTDNTVAANTGIVDGICRPAKKPVFAGEEGIYTSSNTSWSRREMMPFFSHTGINAAGLTKPSFGCFQRTSASAPAISPVCAHTLGWRWIVNFLSSIALSISFSILTSSSCRFLNFSS